MRMSFFVERTAPAPPVQFNPLDMHPNLELSNGDLTVRDKGPDKQTCVRATESFDDGDLYFEVYIDAKASSSLIIGWMDITSPLTSFIGWSATGDGYGYSSLGRVYHNGSFVSAAGYAAGQTAMIAISITPGTTTGKMWVGVNGSWYDGDPATGLGYQRDDLVDNLFPAWGSYRLNHKGTANFGASAFTYSIPVGFSSVDGSQLGI